MNKLSNILQILRHTGYIAIILLCAYWFLDNYFAGYTNWFIAAIGICSLIQLLFRFRYVDVILGYILSLLSAYMVLAVLSDFADYLRGADYKTPLMYFGFGFGIFISATLLSICIIAAHYKKVKSPL